MDRTIRPRIPERTNINRADLLGPNAAINNIIIVLGILQYISQHLEIEPQED